MILPFQNFEKSRGFIFEWWDNAYNLAEYKDRFMVEATAALPDVRIISESDKFERVYYGIQHQRRRLKVDQQLKEWEGKFDRIGKYLIGTKHDTNKS